MPPSPPDFAGQVAKVVVFLTTVNLNKERKRQTPVMGTDERRCIFYRGTDA